MIVTLWRASWLNLSRDRAALALTFALPVAFFSIFAFVFSSMGSGEVQPVKTALVGPVRAGSTHELGSRLAQSGAAEIVATTSDADAATALLRRGVVAAVVVLPDDFESRLAALPAAGERPLVELLVDRSNPLAGPLLSGALQAAAVELLAARLPSLGAPGAGVSTGGSGGPLALSVVDSLGGEDKSPSIAFFAAGIGVMFLLFAVAGRSAVLIEERESGVLTRMLASRLGLTELLIARWLYLASLGAAQVTVMFVWASLVFGLDLWRPRHLVGFLVMTAITAAAAGGFGLLLAVSCRTRAQLNAVSIVAVLVMSALGGSMFPRFLMPERLQLIGLVTFNAWALDGYQKVFWYEAPLAALWPQVAVLAALAVAFLGLARLLVGRSLAPGS